VTNEYKFTTDWFHWAPEVWNQLIPLMASRKAFLEIGSYEGRSTTWIVENMMEEEGGQIICIDTWEGGEEHKAAANDMSEVEKNFDHNMKLLKASHPDAVIGKHVGLSHIKLAGMISDEEGWLGYFDFIYIDGSHIAKDVLTDACMAWPLLKQGGLMVFDDYTWGPPRDALHRPKIAIDAFTNIFGEELEMIHMGYQLVVRKTV
jgi:predicted O-methyltransferase YrrM